jgi:hypothetical protein
VLGYRLSSIKRGAHQAQTDAEAEAVKPHATCCEQIAVNSSHIALWTDKSVVYGRVVAKNAKAAV